MAQTKVQLVSNIVGDLPDGLVATGIVTAQSFSGDLVSSGISTVANLRIVNASTSGIITATNAQISLLNAGISTISSLTSANSNTTGVSTATNFVVGSQLTAGSVRLTTSSNSVSVGSTISLDGVTGIISSRLMTIGSINIDGFANTITSNTLKYIAFASGTTSLFYQAAAPTGWTKSITHDNKALRVVSGTGGGSGGTGGNFTSVFSNRTLPLPSHTHGGTTGNNSVDHTHSASGTTGNQSNDHTHSVSGNTGNQSANHTHTFSGTTGNDSPDHTHSELIRNINNNGLTGGGSAIRAGQGTDPSTTGGASTRHTHGFSGTTAGVSNDHSHFFSVTTGGMSSNHNHSFSATTSGQSTTHNHSFTTNTPTYGGTLGDTLDFSVQYIDVIIASLD